MIRTVSDMLRHLSVITVIVVVAATPQTVLAQGAATPSSSDSAPARTMIPHDDSAPWWISGQINLIDSHTTHFLRSTGPHSFLATPERTISRVLTLYTGVRLGHGWEAFVDIESAGGRGLSDAFGLAGFTDLDVVRNPTRGSAPDLARFVGFVAPKGQEKGNASEEVFRELIANLHRCEILGGVGHKLRPDRVSAQPSTPSLQSVLRCRRLLRQDRKSAVRDDHREHAVRQNLATEVLLKAATRSKAKAKPWWRFW